MLHAKGGASLSPAMAEEQRDVHQTLVRRFLAEKARIGSGHPDAPKGVEAVYKILADEAGVKVGAMKQRLRRARRRDVGRSIAR